MFPGRAGLLFIAQRLKRRDYLRTGIARWDNGVDIAHTRRDVRVIEVLAVSFYLFFFLGGGVIGSLDFLMMYNGRGAFRPITAISAFGHASA